METVSRLTTYAYTATLLPVIRLNKATAVMADLSNSRLGAS